MDQCRAVIMAGGRGTRIASVASDVPKPMILAGGVPILERQIRCLASQGYVDITLVVGHLGGVIKDYFGSGAAFGAAISYFTESLPLGTAGALFPLLEKGADTAAPLQGDFFLINGDLVFDLDFARFLAFHRARGALATLAAHPNSHPYDSALLATGGEGAVTGWINKEDPRSGEGIPYYKNCVNAGIHVINTALLENFAPPGGAASGGKIDLDRDILKPAIPRGGIFAYRTPEYIKDMGTPDRYRQVEADLARGIVAAKNLSRKQRAVFFDRDGTLNLDRGFIRRPEELTLADGAAAAVKAVNNEGYLAIVVTNQPVIARGEASLEDLEAIHGKLETDLGKEGAYLDDIFYCPHHPDKGFPGERSEYKIRCECRKPKPGMLLAAAARYNIDLGESWMVGDDDRDIEAGRAAHCKTAKIGEGGDYRSLADFAAALIPGFVG